MVRLARLLTVAQLLFASHALAAAPTHLWNRTFGGSSSDNANAVAADRYRNVIVVGDFAGTANFGGADLTSAGIADVFIAKYSPTGEHLWSKRYGGTTSDEALAVTVDGNGIIFVAGRFSGTVNFGDGALVSAGNYDAFVLKILPTGVTHWSRRFGSTGNDEVFGVAADASSNVIFGGEFEGTVDFGGGNLVSAGAADGFLVKYSSVAAFNWSKAFGASGAEGIFGVATDASSNVFMTGQFSTSVNFGGPTLLSAGGTDVVVAKYSSGGTHLFSTRYGSTGTDAGMAIATDGSGNVLVGGNFNLNVAFGGSTLASFGSTDLFLAKYTNAGAHTWSQHFGGTSADGLTGVATDPAGNVAITGQCQSTASLGGASLPGNGLQDIVLASYTAAGTHRFSRRAGLNQSDNGFGVCADAAGNVINVGRFVGAVDLGAGPVINSGGVDGFVAKYDAVAGEPDILTIKDLGNDQGRKVQIKFTGSGGDNSDAPDPINSYEAYRKVKAAPSQFTAGAPFSAPREQLLIAGWTFAGSIPAHQESEYTIDAPTIGDSTVAQGPYNSVFFVRAASDNVAHFYDSPPDSGYSLDNLAPGIPLNFVYDAGDLSWNESSAEDFDFFTVYGSNVDLFGFAVVVDYSVAPGMDVTASPYSFYFVTATDFSGNEGKPAKVHTVSGVGGTPKSYVLSVSNYPNPFNPRTTVSYTVPSRGAVTISVYDARGALVATLFNGDRSAGAYTIEWDGRDQSGTPVSTGVFFARIEHNGVNRSKKMVLLK